MQRSVLTDSWKKITIFYWIQHKFICSIIMRFIAHLLQQHHNLKSKVFKKMSIDYFLLNILKIYKNNYIKLDILKYNWQRNFRLIFPCSCGKKDEPWIFWSMTPTHPVRSYTLRIAPRWMSRKRRSFWSRGAHQDARYYNAELYCPRKDRIKFRMIVLSHLWWHLSRSGVEMSQLLDLTYFYLMTLCGKTCECESCIMHLEI